MIALKVIAVILGVLGLIGCIIPVLPGPPLSWVGLLLIYIGGQSGMTTGFLVIWFVIMAVVTVLDYLVPSWFTKKTGGSKAAARGTLVGLFVGLIFFPPLGMIIGSFLGALLAEVIVNGNELSKSIKPALGSFLGFLFSTGLKLISSGVMMFYIIKMLN